VKLIRRNLGESDAQWVKRSTDLVKEGQRMRSATHRNVVTVMQVALGPDGKSVHLALEFCKDGSLGLAYDSGPMSTAS
jgi:hypothetical protein